MARAVAQRCWGLTIALQVLVASVDLRGFSGGMRSTSGRLTVMHPSRIIRSMVLPPKVKFRRFSSRECLTGISFLERKGHV